MGRGDDRQRSGIATQTDEGRRLFFDIAGKVSGSRVQVSGTQAGHCRSCRRTVQVFEPATDDGSLSDVVGAIPLPCRGSNIPDWVPGVFGDGRAGFSARARKTAPGAGAVSRETGYSGLFRVGELEP
jgi:hypothetical protein